MDVPHIKEFNLFDMATTAIVYVQSENKRLTESNTLGRSITYLSA